MTSTREVLRLYEGWLALEKFLLDQEERMLKGGRIPGRCNQCGISPWEDEESVCLSCATLNRIQENKLRRLESCARGTGFG